MRFLAALWLIVFLIGCGDPPGGGLDFDPDKDPVIIGSGDDPGKAASGCYPAFADDELNVVTWNIEWFSSENTNLDKVKTFVQNLDADIIAVQEINSISSFNTLANSIPGWRAFSVDIGGSLDLGFLIKGSSFKAIGPISTEFSTLLRPAAVITATHASGLEVTFFNIHLKCCSDGRNQRIAASNTMKSILDGQYSSDAVIVLGDFNDEILSSSSPFQNFKDDAQNYRFADMGVAAGSTSGYSYPGWPSHIDHIMISNELFGHVGVVQTVIADSCVDSYFSQVSDHRPVLASFR